MMKRDTERESVSLVSALVNLCLYFPFWFLISSIRVFVFFVLLNHVIQTDGNWEENTHAVKGGINTLEKGNCFWTKENEREDPSMTMIPSFSWLKTGSYQLSIWLVSLQISDESSPFGDNFDSLLKFSTTLLLVHAMFSRSHEWAETFPVKH
jgi:hypothetical protein